MNNPGKASLPVIKRLPKYYRYLRTLKNDGITSISSRELAAQMGTTASQVEPEQLCPRPRVHVDFMHGRFPHLPCPCPVHQTASRSAGPSA